MRLLIIFALVAVATSLPFRNGTSQFWQPIFCLEGEGCTFIKSLPRSRAIGTNIPGFKYVFVDSSGRVSNSRGARGTQVEIAGSPLTSQQALNAAADIVAKMTKYMPPNIFTQLATNAAVGVFTAAEKLIVYPEYANLASGSCGNRCDGSCAHTCTFDGRKYEDLAGVGGQRGVVLDDNVLCSARDPYLHTQNILSHEFTHTIHLYALPDSVKQQIANAYNTAKSRTTWTLSAYAMSNDQEYFAEGASVYLFVNTDNNSSGGMDNCGGTLCSSEHAAREHLRVADPGLYNALTYVFTNNRPDLLSGLTICPNPSVVG